MCYIEPKDSEMARAHKKLWKEYKKLMQNIIQDPTNDKFVDGTITYDEVSKSITKAQKGKSAGPDGIVYEMLQTLPKNTLTDMIKMFNFAHTNGICPEIWHHAIIAPLYKKGDCLNPKKFVQLYYEVQLQKSMRSPFSQEFDMSLNGVGAHHQLTNQMSGKTLNMSL
jgi:hypothetical protein